MNKLFWGFFFLFVNFNLNFNGSSINLLPDWLGLILLYQACGELLGESEMFQKPRPFCVGLAIYTGIVWIADLLSIDTMVDFSSVSWVLGLASACLNLYVTMLIVDAITNMEMHRNYDLCAAHLRRVWKVLAVCTVAAHVLLILPVLAALCLVITAVSYIVFLVAVHGTRKAYHNMIAEQSKPF